MKKFKITIEFTGGILKGLTHESTQHWPREVGRHVKKPCAGSPYRVISCEEIR